MNHNNGNGRSGGLTDDAPIDELDERLVAYLDGELQPDDRKQLEIELGRSAQLRARLRTLQDGWEMLDDLPTAIPSPVLLESTLRMAATEATLKRRPRAASWHGPLGGLFTSRTMLVLLLSVFGFAGGALAVRVNNHIRFQNQLHHLPVAMNVDAYLHGDDLELMRSLMQMPQWQEAVAIADQLGAWDIKLQQTITEATPQQRQEMLPRLPDEEQQVVADAWQRFEKLGEQEKQAVIKVASTVAAQSDADQLLATMNRYALWRDSLHRTQLEQIEGADLQQRQAAIVDAIQRTTQQWTRQTSRRLSDEDFETIYQALRQIARLRIKTLDLDDADVSALALQTLQTFGTSEQVMDLRSEAWFLRSLFQPRDFGQQRGESGPRGQAEPPRGQPGSPPGEAATPRGEPAPPRGEPGQGSGSDAPPPPSPPGFDLFSQTFREILPMLEQLQGPLDHEELWMIESVLSPEIASFLAAASHIEGFREDLLRSWADDAIRRMSWRRSGGTPIERYELIDPSRRDQLDLQPPDRMLEWLREAGRRPRPFP